MKDVHLDLLEPLVNAVKDIMWGGVSTVKVSNSDRDSGILAGCAAFSYLRGAWEIMDPFASIQDFLDHGAGPGFPPASANCRGAHPVLGFRAHVLGVTKARPGCPGGGRGAEPSMKGLVPEMNQCDFERVRPQASEDGRAEIPLEHSWQQQKLTAAFCELREGRVVRLGRLSRDGGISPIVIVGLGQGSIRGGEGPFQQSGLVRQSLIGGA
jgi:hypothetical protein